MADKKKKRRRVVKKDKWIDVEGTFNRRAWIAYYLDRALTKMWNWYPIRHMVRDAAESRPGFRMCAKCGLEFNNENTQVDHIVPKVNIKTGDLRDWNEMVDRHLCEIENLQVLCLTCHGRKSLSENKLRWPHKKWTK